MAFVSRSASRLNRARDGTASGICNATAQRLAREGARVAMFDVDGERGNAIAGQIKDLAGDAALPSAISHWRRMHVTPPRA
jgi:NAD(P)-dependent dehydrogenase (short-subunit alcohol dehydrogenase family)